MLLAHARILARARSHLAALADNASTFDASLEYDRILLELDALYGDSTPAVYAVPALGRPELFAAAAAAIEDLVVVGVDALTVELLLVSLEGARARDVP
jgi:hypothetical protein